MRSAVALALTAATAVYAQGTQKFSNFTSSLDMTIVPETVDAPLRGVWCRGQENTCTLLCGDDTKTNECELETLKYDCKCASNSSAPGLQYYTETLPTFICKELFGQCIAAHPNDADGQNACTKDIDDKCATQNPPKEPVGGGSSSDGDDDDDDTTSSATSARPAQTPQPSGSGSGSGNDNEPEDNVTTTSSDGLAAPTLVPGANGVAAVAAIGVLAYLI